MNNIINNAGDPLRSDGKYYYARSEKTVGGEKYLEVPMIVNPKSVNINPEYVYNVRIGFHQVLCVYIWIPESYYPIHKCLLERDAKAEARNARCRIIDPDGSGRRIRCPERYRCSACPNGADRYADRYDNGHEISLEVLMRKNRDPNSDGEQKDCFDIPEECSDPAERCLRNEEEKEAAEKTDALTAWLGMIKPRYAMILREMVDGECNVTAIAKRFGLRPNRTAEDIQVIRKLAQKWMKRREAQRTKK